MGLPTTANYSVVASVMAQPLVSLAARNGLAIPLLAVHLFVFFFGLMPGTTLRFEGGAVIVDNDAIVKSLTVTKFVVVGLGFAGAAIILSPERSDYGLFLLLPVLSG